MIPQEWTSLERLEMEMEQRPKFKVIKGGKKGGKRRVVVQQKDEVIENVDILISGIKRMIKGTKRNQRNIDKILEEWEFEHSLRGGKNDENQG